MRQLGKRKQWAWFGWVSFSNSVVSGSRILSDLTRKPSSSAIGAQVPVTSRVTAPTPCAS